LRPSDVCDAWAEELEAIVEVGGLFDLTMHPFISGRPARAAALEKLIEKAQAMDGVWVAAGDEIAAWVAGLDLPPITHEPPKLDPR
jgi:peptidoglycan/xylan/chitin deacetylase (PgdA/CDA1 family)